MSIPIRTRPGAVIVASVGRATFALLVAVFASTATGCGGRDDHAETPLRVSAAASLSDVMAEVGPAFTAATGTAVEVTAGGSGALAAQIEQGGGCDVFVSADTATVDRLDAAGLLVAGSRRVIAGNRLVLVVPAGSPLGSGDFADVANAKRFGRIAVGEPRTVPAGRYARQAFASLGVADAVSPRLVEGLDVRQVVQYVRSGEVDAGVVYASDAASAGGAVRVYAVAPKGSHAPIEYVAAAVSGSGRERQSGVFVALLAGDAGRTAFESRGFLPPLVWQGGD